MVAAHWSFQGLEDQVLFPASRTAAPEPVQTKKSGGAGGGLLLIAMLFLFNRLNGKN